MSVQADHDLSFGAFRRARTTNGRTIQPDQTHGFASTGGGPAARIRIDHAFGDTRIALSTDRNAATEIGIRSRFDAVTVALRCSNRASLLRSTALLPGSISGVDGSGLEIPGSVLAVSGHYDGGTWGVGLLVVRVGYPDALSPFSHSNHALSGNVEPGGATLTAGIERGSGGGVTFTSASVGVAFTF